MSITWGSTDIRPGQAEVAPSAHHGFPTHLARIRSKPTGRHDVSDSSTAVVSAHLPVYPMSSTVSLTDLQLAIVRILWEHGESTVLEVQEALAPERRLAQTTVATILTRLEKRRIVKHQNKGRLFVYKALVTEPQVRRSMVSDLTELLFDGSPAALISHLLSEKEIDPRDLDEVKRMIADAERTGTNAG